MVRFFDGDQLGKDVMSKHRFFSVQNLPFEVSKRVVGAFDSTSPDQLIQAVREQCLIILLQSVVHRIIGIMVLVVCDELGESIIEIGGIDCFEFCFF